MASLRLVPVSGPAIDVVKDQSMVGRDPSCEIVVTDGSVSRRHARLEKRGGTWWVVDQGSANGTYVNSLKVAEQALKNHQELRFGAAAFRVDIVEDPEATVATPILADDSATVMAPSFPPPAAPAAPPPVPAPPTPPPALPPPLPPAASAPPPAPPSAAAARERFRPAAPAAPVPQMPAGAPPANKGKSPLFWVAGGCGGCLLLIVALIVAISGGVWMSSRGARAAAQAWVGHLRTNDLQAARAGLTDDCGRLMTDEDLAKLATAVAASPDLSFRLWGGRSISVESDTVDLFGVLGGTGESRSVTFHLIRKGAVWKIDKVRLEE
jgi:hypothetical protein